MFRISARPARFTIALAASLSLVAGAASSASADTKVWIGGNGNYGVDGNWSPSGVPLNTDDVFIGGTTDLVVDYSGGLQRAVKSLTLGGTAGTQELRMKATSTSGDARLVINGASTVTSHGVITQDQDSTGGQANAPSLELAATLTNNGTIIAKHEGAGTVDQIVGTGSGYPVINNQGTIHVQSGRLKIGPTVNAGTILVDAAGSYYADAGADAMTNAGTVTNNGEVLFAASQWTQNAGSITGNPVHIATGTLTDAGGTGSFLVTGNGAKVAGTVPSGQTVQFGDPLAEESDIIKVLGSSFTVAPGGTLVLAPPPGNGVQIVDNAVVVDGLLKVKADSKSARIEAGLTIGSGGSATVESGATLDLFSLAANHGTLTVAPGGRVRQVWNSGTTNFTSDGSLVFQLASPTSYGAVKTINGVPFAPAGSVTGAPVGGYTPAIGASFPVIQLPVTGSAFTSVGGDFSATYPADKSGVSLVYTGPAAQTPADPAPAAPTPAGPTPAGPTPAGPTPVVIKCVVPNLKGKTTKQARTALTAAHCKLGSVKKKTKKSKYVVSQSRKKGSTVAADSKVGITLGAKPKPKKKS